MGPCSRSVLITFIVRITHQHPANISFLKKLVQRSIEAQSLLPSKNRNKTSVPVTVLVRKRVIKALVLAQSCFNSCAPELVPIFYSAIKHGYRYGF